MKRTINQRTYCLAMKLSGLNGKMIITRAFRQGRRQQGYTRTAVHRSLGQGGPAGASNLV